MIEYYSATKRNRVLIYGITWIIFENLIPNERSWTYVLYDSIFMNKSMEIESRLVVARGGKGK
jgi:hypothetical protein